MLTEDLVFDAQRVLTCAAILTRPVADARIDDDSVADLELIVGDATEIGKTARAAAEETDAETPLNQQLERLSKLIGVVGLGIIGFLFAAVSRRASR